MEAKIEVKGKLYSRFRRANIFLFTLAFFVMTVVMILLLRNIVTRISVTYAERYARISAEALSAHLDSGVNMVSKLARSGAIFEWMADEYDEQKKARAFDEMTGMVKDLYSNNLYVVLENSRSEYRIISGYESIDTPPYKTIDENDPNDAWYFNCIGADNDYVLKVALDYEMERKRVWIDYKVTAADGTVLGAVCTGLEFTQAMYELFSLPGGDNIRGLIIDENGIILMDSAHSLDDEYLYTDADVRFDEEFQNPALIDAVRKHLDGGRTSSPAVGQTSSPAVGQTSSPAVGAAGTSSPEAIRLSYGSYHFVTIMPIRSSNWSVIVLSDIVSLFNMSHFIPVFIIILIILIAFALIIGTFNSRLIFLPLSKLKQSLPRLKENDRKQIYGVERDDELGDLSRTIEDLFSKAHIDALTGIHNRRFMEGRLDQVVALLSRSGGSLGVLMVDIDFFKGYNDTYGHDQGDICLKNVAKAISASVLRSSDFTARYGGEEFIVILPETDESGACNVAAKILDNVRSLNMPHSSSAAAPYVTVSVGATTGTVAYTRNWEDYVKRADEALYTSKNNGRNRFTYVHL